MNANNIFIRILILDTVDRKLIFKSYYKFTSLRLSYAIEAILSAKVYKSQLKVKIQLPCIII